MLTGLFHLSICGILTTHYIIRRKWTFFIGIGLSFISSVMTFVSISDISYLNEYATFITTILAHFSVALLMISLIFIDRRGLGHNIAVLSIGNKSDYYNQVESSSDFFQSPLIKDLQQAYQISQIKVF